MLHNILTNLGFVEKKNPKEFLYIFLHIQKCAGTTITEHALNQFGGKRVLCNEMFVTHLYHQYNQDTRMLVLTASRDESYMKKQWVDDILSKIEEREQVRLLAGHRTYYGIHKLFHKPTRYFIFLRDPVERVISWYNNFIRSPLDRQEIFETVRDDGSRVPFEEWVEKSNMAPYSMTALLSLRFSGVNIFDFKLIPTEKDLENAKALLREMYFVGLTESDEDKDFIYQRLGITKFLPNQNVGRELGVYVLPKNYEDAKRVILSRIPFDQELYEYAKKLNQEMRLQIEDYARAVAYTRFRRRFLGGAQPGKLKSSII